MNIPKEKFNDSSKGDYNILPTTTATAFFFAPMTELQQPREILPPSPPPLQPLPPSPRPMSSSELPEIFTGLRSYEARRRTGDEGEENKRYQEMNKRKRLCDTEEEKENINPNSEKKLRNQDEEENKSAQGEDVDNLKESNDDYYFNEITKFLNAYTRKPFESYDEMDFQYEKENMINMIDINRILEESFFKGENALQVQNFMNVFKIRGLYRRQYIENSRELIYNINETLHRENCDDEDFIKLLASLNVLYFKYDFSYVYASFCEITSKYKMGIVTTKGIELLGYIEDKHLRMIMKRNCPNWN